MEMINSFTVYSLNTYIAHYLNNLLFTYCIFNKMGILATNSMLTVIT